MAIRITCINKDEGDHENPYVAISHLGWVNELNGNSGRCTREELYDYINSKMGTAYVKDRWGNQAEVITAETGKGTKYVKTAADSVTSDNLLSLPECE
ncbi:hypothetical protein OC25_02010 [Pedobacter kyungheensis]|uniref:DUF3892 domain-containing protein n=1 Tax=Pedobacter kyungheensis TaxID=1069985 RepID=A0A0C1G8W2_9SPHI|nr:DUF3892 domain-containing protein [Pedobacter kyungheensis]KIA96544.1 hypothetical protein OC25_02010 [Pedobacter kyungheensis]